MAAITVHVKHGSANHAVQIAPDATLQQLSEHVERMTNVFVRQQKLIFKGKVLDGAKKLKDQGVGDGAKLMMLAQPAPNVTTITKGQQAASTAAQLRSDEARTRLAAAYATARGQPNPTVKAAEGETGSFGVSVEGPGSSVSVARIADRQRSWRAMGVISLRELNLPALPHTLLVTQPSATTPAAKAAAAGSGTQPAPQGDGSPEAAAWSAWAETTRGLDMCQNQLTRLPAALSCLTGLTALKASHNQLQDVPGPSLPVSLSHLTLDHNKLSKVPDGALGTLTQLRSLSLSHNQLKSLPSDIGRLGTLQVLDLTCNQLEALPEELGDCGQLVELCAAGNAITSIPPSLAKCHVLQALRLDRNRISTVPSVVLRGAISLWLLSVSANPISLDALRETDGYKELDERRKNRADKQIESRVLLDGSSAFSEGADVQNWQHWL